MSGQAILAFGKYKQLTLDQVIKEHPSWCHWFINQSKTKFPEKKEYIQKFINKDDHYINVGKYKEFTIEQLCKQQPSYAKWLIEQDWWKQNKRDIVDLIRIEFAL